MKINNEMIKAASIFLCGQDTPIKDQVGVIMNDTDGLHDEYIDALDGVNVAEAFENTISIAKFIDMMHDAQKREESEPQEANEKPREGEFYLFFNNIDEGVKYREFLYKCEDGSYCVVDARTFNPKTYRDMLELDHFDSFANLDDIKVSVGGYEIAGRDKVLEFLESLKREV